MPVRLRAALHVAVIPDVTELGVFLVVKAHTDTLVIYISLAGMAVIFAGKRLFLKHDTRHDDGDSRGAETT